jgi:hypothetical protein
VQDACRSFLFRPHGEAQGPSAQALALAATKSGANSTDLQQLASLGNYGRSSEHIASQMISKYCKSDSIKLPEPYFVDIQMTGCYVSSQWHCTCHMGGLHGYS